MENYPPELQTIIYESLTDPDEILKLGYSNRKIHEILRKAIKKLRAPDELLYLDVGWLTHFHNLEDVDDNIIFSINAAVQQTYIIPRNLKRFNIRILMDSSMDITDNTITYDIAHNILERITGNIYDYTVRIIINYESDPNHDSCLVIDLGNLVHLNSFNTGKLSFTKPQSPN